MMSYPFLEQSRETPSSDTSSDDPFPMGGVFKFLKNVFFLPEPSAVIHTIFFIFPPNSRICVREKLKRTKSFSIGLMFQKYFKGVTVLSGVFPSPANKSCFF